MAASSTVLSGTQIQENLRAFAQRWAQYAGTEAGEAQTFTNELFASYGSDRKQVGAVSEDSQTSHGIMDLRWGDWLIVEMKAPAESPRLDKHRDQALKYWRHSADAKTERPAAQYVVLCSFHRFEIWEPGKYPAEPRASFSLDELPDRYETLLFLTNAGDEALFSVGDRRLTTQATQAVAHLNKVLVERRAAPPKSIQSFLLQMVWLFFSERYGMLTDYPALRLLKAGKQLGVTSGVLLGGLFLSLGQQQEHARKGVLKGTRYVNGGLFENPSIVHLEEEEVDLLLEAGEYDWSKVDPTIFGSLVEGFLGESRSALGAHYTHEADILKIVRPTIVRPWQRRINAAGSPQEAYELLGELCRFRVLDPACGCGNFLYVAYRELRALEAKLKERIAELAEETSLAAPAGPLPYYPLSNLYGFDVETVATQVSRLTLWMGQRQMLDRFGQAEPPLPLVELHNLATADALTVEWPETDCVIGNPPFLGSQNLGRAHGAHYLDWLKQTYQVGIKDYCVYWFRKTHDHLKPGQRAGLVGTNSIAQPAARESSLGYITGSGGVITDAVSSQKWPGVAKVHVSIASWVKEPVEAPEGFLLDGTLVTGISSQLRTAERSTDTAGPLAANKGKCFQGPIPGWRRVRTQRGGGASATQAR